MDKFDPVVDSDDDKDLSDATTCDESGSEGEDELDEKNEVADADINMTIDEWKHVMDLTANDIKGLDFGSEDEAAKFYYSYAGFHGFLVRRDEVRRDLQGNIIMRQFVCNREGIRNKKHFTRVDRLRNHKPLTRTNCRAKLRIHLDYKTSKWTVVSFEECHNHDLTPAKFSHLNAPYRVMTDADKAQVDSLHSYGVRTCHIMGYLLAQKGGYGGVGFLKKDLHNHFDRSKRERIKDGDLCTVLSYLQCKANNDPLFYSEYTTTKDGKLKNLFWADGGSIADFQCFNDVLAFDATYKKNKYNYPLVIFSGCNHHSQTIIFGCALVSEETSETYKWVLESFLKAMSNKEPKAVMTDVDAAMREAIKSVFPNASHRLCAWHLYKNACENVKNSGFLKDFKTAMYHNFTPDGFEDYWKRIVQKHGLAENRWVSKTYENKELWATAYFRDKFFGRIRTTSQCEAINALVKTYVRRKSSIIEFMDNFEQALREYRNNELMADFKSFFTEPVMTTSLYKLEREASKIYTLDIFKEVKHEIEEGCALNVVERIQDGEKLIFKLNEYGKPDSFMTVVYDTGKSNFFCECQLFESRGIPCSHIICVMKQEHVDNIPSSLIRTRWTKNAKKDLISSDQSNDLDNDVRKVARFGAVAGACNKLCDIAAQKSIYFNDIMDDIFKLTKKYEIMADPHNAQKSSNIQIGDPTVVRTKGAPKKKKHCKKRRHCSNCNGTAHNVRKCPKILGKVNKRMKKEELSSSESYTNIEVGEVLACNAKKDNEKLDPSSLNNGSKDHIPQGSSGNKEHNPKGANRSEDHISQGANGPQGSNGNKDHIPQGASGSKDHIPEGASGSKDHIPQARSVLPTPQSLPIAALGTVNGGSYTFPQNPSVPSYPYYSGVPLYPQFPTMPYFPQIPQYFGGGQHTSWNGFLHDVMNKNGQLSDNHVQP